MLRYRLKDTVKKISQATGRQRTSVIARSSFARSETVRALMKSKRGMETGVSIKKVPEEEEV